MLQSLPSVRVQGYIPVAKDLGSVDMYYDINMQVPWRGLREQWGDSHDCVPTYRCA